MKDSSSRMSFSFLPLSASTGNSASRFCVASLTAARTWVACGEQPASTAAISAPNTVKPVFIVMDASVTPFWGHGRASSVRRRTYRGPLRRHHRGHQLQHFLLDDLRVDVCQRDGALRAGERTRVRLGAIADADSLVVVAGGERQRPQ